MSRPFWSFRTSAPLDNCETIEPLLSLAADGAASAEETRCLDAHLPGCADCRAALSSMQATHAALASRPIAVPPPDLHSRIALAIALSSRPVAALPPDLHSRIALAIASAAPVTLRPARVFTLRTAYAAAASLTALGIALSYPLWHAPDELAVKHPSRPTVVAVVPPLKTPTAPKIAKRPLVASVPAKSLTVKHTVIAHKTDVPAVTPPEHTASNEAPTLPAAPQVVKVPVHRAPLSPQIASRDIILSEKHSIEHSPLPPVKTPALKPLEGSRIAKIIKEPIHVPVDIQPTRVTPDVPPAQVASMRQVPSSASSDPLSFYKARLKENETKIRTVSFASVAVPVGRTAQEAMKLPHALGGEEQTAFISAVHGNQ